MIQFSGKAILLDIEGTTASVDFVHQVMFPFVTNNLGAFLDQNWDRPAVTAACNQIAHDAGCSSLESWAAAEAKAPRAVVEQKISDLMGVDSKTTGLKAMQGLVWEAGFISGELVAPVYDDVLPALQLWNKNGIDVRIYSSGSMAAQKLFFGHTQHGDILSQFRGHYDTTFGGKKEAESYRRIAAHMGFQPNEILFVSDLEGELLAAREAGVQVAAAIRPGNAPLSKTASFPEVSSFDQISLH